MERSHSEVQEEVSRGEFITSGAPEVAETQVEMERFYESVENQ